METCPQSVAFCKSTLSKTITPEMLAMPRSRSCNKSLAPFQSVCLLFGHNHNIFHFFSLLHERVASHLIQPLPASLLLNQPKCLKHSMVNLCLRTNCGSCRPNRSRHFRMLSSWCPYKLFVFPTIMASAPVGFSVPQMQEGLDK